MPSASALVYAGVKFAPDTGNDLFKFKFSEPKGRFRWCHRARFEIPPLAIYDDTESYLRNLIALEQCCAGVSLHVSSYAFVMDMLVDNEKDIQVLEEAGVLRNYLGTAEDAANLFNKLGNEIIEGGYFADTCIRATEYSKRFWPKNMAHVRRTYFKSPWTFIAFCVGFIVFIMAVLQFVHDFRVNKSTTYPSPRKDFGVELREFKRPEVVTLNENSLSRNQICQVGSLISFQWKSEVEFHGKQVWDSGLWNLNSGYHWEEK
ncbi:putative UPF0481 protein At3g02645 [Rhododendron vialii]|uniref:putative UPF0481 protein At3g02645 n=1 Tax=Rhododendron vialii TaxID=182163 RepID=UPI00265F0F27|nr:putative UPF0481 protein At3g02645 [Rhododendron vialii]